MSHLTKQNQALIGLVVMNTIIGLSFIFVKFGLRYAGAMDLLAHRFTAAALSIVILWAVGVIKIPAFNLKKAKPLLTLSLFYPLLFFSLQTFGMEYSSASEAGIIFASTPIITLLAARIFLKEKTTWLQRIGIVLSIAGIVYIILNTDNGAGNTSLKGVILLLLSVFSIVAYYVLGKKISMHFSAMEITVWMTLLAFVFFNGWSVISHLQSNSLNEFFNPLLQQQFLWAVLYLGVLSSMITALLTNYALTKVPASQIAVFNNISPVIAIIGGVLILSETLYLYHIIGGLLVLAGVGMTVIYKQKSN